MTNTNEFIPRQPQSINIVINYFPASYWEPIESENDKRDVEIQWSTSREWIEKAVLKYMSQLLAEEEEHVHSIDIHNLKGMTKYLTCPLVLTIKDRFKYTKLSECEDD